MTTRRQFLVGGMVLGAGAALPAGAFALDDGLRFSLVLDPGLPAAARLADIAMQSTAGPVDLPDAGRIIAASRERPILGVTRFSDRILFEQLAFADSRRFALLTQEGQLHAQPQAMRARALADALAQTPIGRGSTDAAGSRLPRLLAECAASRAASIWVIGA